MQEKIFQALAAEHNAMLTLWQELVNMDSGSSHVEGVNAVAAKLADLLQKLGLRTEQIPFAQAGNLLIAHYGDTSKPFIALIGHMDTVFKKGTAAQRPFTVKDGKAYGPGCLDMKGGLVILLTALKLLASQGYTKYPLKVILAGDEEVGHGHSDAANLLMEASRGALAAFDFETSFTDHGIVTERKGVWSFEVECFGRSAHAGNDPQNGRSAIMELLPKALAIGKLNDFAKNIFLNVGVIEGGTVANAVADYAKIKCDLRFNNYEDLLATQQKVQEILAQQYIPATQTKLNTLVTFRNMQLLPQTQGLYNKVCAAAAALGQPLPPAKSVGGASDAAYTTAVGVPTICAIGVEGARNHTSEEYALVRSLFERTQLICKILLDF